MAEARASSTAQGVYTIGVDIGGTCTDCVVMDEAGTVTVGKSFSTPPDFSRGILDAVQVAAETLGIGAEELLAATRLFLHSTTVAENVIVGGTLTPTGLITTRGHRDTLFATRGGFGRWSGLSEDEKRNPTETEKPSTLVPATRIRAVRERIYRDGQVWIPLKESEVEEAVRALLEAGAQSIGVCFLWSFVNPENELTARKVIERVAPGAFVTLSHEIAPIAGEYERTSTVALNASLGPVVESYLTSLTARLDLAGFRGTLLIMQAHGGLVPVRVAATRPVGMIESGPVGGLMGCKRMGELLGAHNLVSADLGGTTFKVGLVRRGLVEYQRESMVLRYHYSLPKLDIESLGLAGGSIVWIDQRTGTPRIGPRSAGSYPGPVAYGHGGTDPTLTDVDVILGFMNPGYFLGGRAGLDAEASRRAFAENVAEPLLLDTLDAASRIYALANSYIYDLLHRMTVQRGVDPRSCALFSVGGTAGMHLPSVAADLGVPTVVIPYTASVQGAFGLVTSEVVHEELIARPMVGPWDPEAVNATFDALIARVVRQLEEDGFPPEEMEVTRAIDMRYLRQVHVVTAPVLKSGPITAQSLEATSDLFEDLYRQKYGSESTYREAGIELVTFRVRGSGRLPTPDPIQRAGSAHSAEEALVDLQPVYLLSENRMAEIPGYDLDRLGVGTEVAGPALIWSPITTVVLDPGRVARMDPYRNLVITGTGEVKPP